MTDQPGGGQPPGGDGGWGQQPPQGGWGQQPPQQGGGQPQQPQQQGGWQQQPPQQQQPAAEQYPAGFFGQMADSGYQPDEEEVTQAFNAHLFGALVALFCCGLLLPVAAPLIVFATAKEKKPFMLFHVNQSIMFQAIAVVLILGIDIVSFILGSFTCGIGWILGIVHVVPWIAAVVYPLVVGMAAKRGEWAEYPVLGQKLMREWKPPIK